MVRVTTLLLLCAATSYWADLQAQRNFTALDCAATNGDCDASARIALSAEPTIHRVHSLKLWICLGLLMTAAISRGLPDRTHGLLLQPWGLALLIAIGSSAVAIVFEGVADGYEQQWRFTAGGLSSSMSVAILLDMIGMSGFIGLLFSGLPEDLLT